MLTPERLKAIKERCERATEGPWIVSPNRHKAKDGSQWGIIEARIRTVTGGIVAHTICTWDGDNGRANAEFIRAAREDVPALVAEVERLHGFLSELRKRVGHWRLEARNLQRDAGDASDAEGRDWLYGRADGLEWAADQLEAMVNKLEAKQDLG